MIDSAAWRGVKALNVLTGDTLYRVLDQIPPPLAFLADAVTLRRRALGLTRDGLHETGGPAPSTLARIESPTPSTAFPRPTTLDRLDKALKWQSGSAARCLDMRDPVSLEDTVASTGASGGTSAPNIPVPGDPLDFSYVAVPVEVLREGLTLIQQNLAPTDLPGGSTALRGLIQFAQKLSAAHATEVLERFGGPSRTVPGFLQTTFAPYLGDAAPFEESSPSLDDDQRYRRWLAGLSADEGGRYHERWHRKQRALQTAAI